LAGPFEEYFREYALAFDDFDHERVASHYHCPCVMVDAGSASSLETELAIVNNMRAVLRHNREQGYCRGEVSDIRVEFLAESLAIARVHWQIFDREGGLLWDFSNTYNLADYGAGWKILVSTTHASAP